jgi:hypothetical protein
MNRTVLSQIRPIMIGRVDIRAPIAALTVLVLAEIGRWLAAAGTVTMLGGLFRLLSLRMRLKFGKYVVDKAAEQGRPINAAEIIRAATPVVFEHRTSDSKTNEASQRTAQIDPPVAKESQGLIKPLLPRIYGLSAKPCVTKTISRRPSLDGSSCFRRRLRSVVEQQLRESTCRGQLRRDRRWRPPSRGACAPMSRPCPPTIQ